MPLTATSRMNVHELARKMLAELKKTTSLLQDDCIIADPCTSDHAYTNPSKKRKTTSTLDDEFEDWLEDAATLDEDEIIRYSQCSFDQ